MRSFWLTAGCLHSWIPTGLLLGGLLQGGALACNNSEQGAARPQAVVQTPQSQTVSRNTSPASPANQAAASAEPAAASAVQAALPSAPASSSQSRAQVVHSKSALPAVATAGGSAGAADDPAPAPAAVTRGKAVTTEAYSVWLETAGSYSAGKAGQLRVVLEAKAPHKCNVEYPYKFTFGAAPKELTYPSPVVHEMKVEGKHANMALPIKPKAPGTATVQGTLNFSVCTEDKCLIEKADLSVAIQID